MEKFENYREYLLYMENNYDEEDQLIIEGFIAYYINKYRGFGHKKCESTYQESLQYDRTGKLHQFAMIGFEFEKKNIEMRKKMKLQK